MLFINTPSRRWSYHHQQHHGIFGVAAGLSGFVFRNMKWWERILCIVGGLTLLVPGSLTDLIGLVLVGAVCVLGYQAAKKEKEMLAA